MKKDRLLQLEINEKDERKCTEGMPQQASRSRDSVISKNTRGAKVGNLLIEMNGNVFTYFLLPFASLTVHLASEKIRTN